MKNKTIVKIILDVLMVIVLALMYSKNALGLSFHEIGGLAVIGAFLIHNLLNFKWIAGVTGRLRRASGRTRFMWAVDALMLAAFLLIGVSGVFISKVVFPSANGGGAWKTIHYTSSAVALILVGVHLGLHASYLKGIFGRMIRLPRVIGIALVCILVGFGAYSASTTNLIHWLALPFASTVQGARSGPGDFADNEATAAADSDKSSGDQANGGGNGKRDGSGEGLGLNGAGAHAAGGGASAINALQTFATYFSIAFLFAAITAIIEKMARWTSKKRRARMPNLAPQVE
jgi:uncharacterized membrane protein YgcG